MRGILFAVLVAAGVALVGAPSASAAPAGGAAIGEAAAANGIVSQVQHFQRRSHFRFGSGGPRCTTVCRHRPFSSARVCTRRCG